MHLVTRRIEWDAMHRVPGHDGACRAFHGHRYAAEFEVGAPCLDQAGMVVDFGVVKKIIGSWIDANLDHTAILWRMDPDPVAGAIAKANEAYGKPAYFMDHPPTAENIVLELARISGNLLSDHPVTLSSIRLWETPNCSAFWCNPKR